MTDLHRQVGRARAGKPSPPSRESLACGTMEVMGAQEPAAEVKISRGNLVFVVGGVCVFVFSELRNHVLRHDFIATTSQSREIG